MQNTCILPNAISFGLLYSGYVAFNIKAPIFSLYIFLFIYLFIYFFFVCFQRQYFRFLYIQKAVVYLSMSIHRDENTA